ncbi:MAG: hypothetical protein H7338_02720 [Candidatus Sericytochromatia bacterium]|nr:hypothetical protein [Candidatus Sericytochromatia bacterium]
MARMTPESSKSSLIAVGASGRRSRATAQLNAPETPRVWNGGEVGPDGVGLYRRFTMGAAERGWRLEPNEIEMLLDVYVAYVRRDEEASPARCLRILKHLRRRVR